MKRLLLPTFIIVVMAAFLMGTAVDADATFMLQLTDMDTGEGVLIADQEEGKDSGADIGVIVFIGGVGGFNINVTTGLSKPVVGPARIDLCSVNVSGGAGTLEIMLTDTDFFEGTEIAGVTLENAWGGTAAHEVTAQGFLDIYNRDLDEFNSEAEGVFQTYFQGPLGPGAFDSTVGGEEEIGSFTGPFSLTERVTITHTSGRQSTSFNKFLEATVYQVPDASVAFLLGSAFLLGFAVLRRKVEE